MSCNINEIILEKLYEDFLELGYTEKRASELANEQEKRGSVSVPIEYTHGIL